MNSFNHRLTQTILPHTSTSYNILQVLLYVVFLIFLTGYLEAFAQLNQDIVDIQWKEQPKIRSKEVIIDFSQKQQLEFEKDIHTTKKGIEISAYKQTGMLISEKIKVPIENPEPFLAVGAYWKAEYHDEARLAISIRASADGNTWGEWFEMSVDEHATPQSGEVYSNLVFLDKNTSYIQYRIILQRGLSKVSPLMVELRLVFISPGTTPSDILEQIKKAKPQGYLFQMPVFISRTAWGCPEGQRSDLIDPKWSPQTTNVTHLIIHHTATPNNSTDWPAVVRSIWEYHKYYERWGDIGYNWLIDPNGVIYQGRSWWINGDDSPKDIIGAHFCEKNTYTIGIALLGTFTSVSPTTNALSSLKNILAWKCSQKSIDPLGTTYHQPTGLYLKNISGHRDGCPNECPGSNLYAQIPSIRNDVKNLISQPQTPPLSIKGIVPDDILVNVAPYDAILTLTGSGFSGVKQVKFSWSGVVSGSATWNKGDASWVNKVEIRSDTLMVLKPRVVESNPTWVGIVNWVVTLSDGSGQSASASFKVRYYPYFTISGYVRTSGGVGISDVLMSGLPRGPRTDASGYYRDTVSYGWSGTVTPMKSGYTFSPPSVTYSNVTSNQITNYTGTPQTTLLTHEILLIKGWNMISSFVIPLNSKLDSIFNNIKSNIVLLKDGSGSVFWPSLGIDQIVEWNVYSGYQIYLKNPDTLKIIGHLTKPETTSYSLQKGWNLISYIRKSPMNIDSALSTIKANITIVKDNNGNVYWPKFNINQIGLMRPGQGYQINVIQQSTFNYPANDQPSANINFTFRGLTDNLYNVTSEPVHFRFVKNTGNNATVGIPLSAQPLVDNTPLEVGDEIGAFTPAGLCVGAVVWENKNTALTVWGDDEMTPEVDGIKPGEPINYKIWKKSTDVEYQATATYSLGNGIYQPNAIFILSTLNAKSTAVGISDAGLPNAFILFQNYPNPFNPTTTIKYGIPIKAHVKLEIYNTLGQKIETLINAVQEPGFYLINLDASHLSGGVYFYRLTAISENKIFSASKKLTILK